LVGRVDSVKKKVMVERKNGLMTVGACEERRSKVLMIEKRKKRKLP